MDLLTRPTDPKATDTKDNESKRPILFLETPAVGAGFVAMTLFMLIAFFSNVLLAPVTMATLGITVTLGTLGILALILLILFLF
ncbi:MAG TPA: hypothetical protein VFC58_04840 [Desulfosporosinus sp.]|nr:hypothetical protein [Desulfosporosinus sp.]